MLPPGGRRCAVADDRLERFKQTMLADARRGDYESLASNIDSLMSYIKQLEREKREAEDEVARLRGREGRR